MMNTPLSQDELQAQRETADAFAIPVMRVLFRQILDHAANELSLSNTRRKRIEREIDRLYPEFDPGCLEVMMDDGKLMFIVLDECPKDYDLTDDFNKLVLTEEKMGILKRNLSLVIHLVRLRYIHFIRSELDLVDLLKDIVNYDIDEIRVAENTTLYVNPDFETRLGFYVRTPPEGVVAGQ